ncbi:MAG: hypothetical protein Q8O33_14095 [Pseudomonadota bacterium]|nr:hypothetical protein [Pseudomonadota bacterium]
MELKSTQFDMTDPFARQEVLARKVERHLLAMPAARRQAILADFLPPIMAEPPRLISMPVTTTRFPMEAQPLPQAAPVSMPTVIYRPRRIRRPLTRQEWLLLVTLRLALRLHRAARKQVHLKLKASRRFMRRALQRHRAIRGY